MDYDPTINLSSYIPGTGVGRVAMISVHTSPYASFGARDTGGMNVYVRELSRSLAQRGVLVDAFTRRDDPAPADVEYVDDGVRLIRVEAGPAAPVNKDSLFCHLPAFASEMAYRAIKEGARYDLLHAHYWLSGWAGHLLRQHWDAPLVMTFHTLGHLKNAVATVEQRETTLRLQVERRLVDLADAVIVSNPDEHREFIRRLNAPPRRVKLVPPGVDLARFQPTDSWAARRRLGLPDSPLVLFVGRIDPVKGIDTLFEAFPRLIQSGEWPAGPPKLVFVGGVVGTQDNLVVMDSDLRQLATRAAELGLADDVLFHGAQPRERMPLYYNAVDVCAVPSRYESFGLVAVEAMACGTPIVASSVGGLRFTIDDGFSGLLVPHSDPAALSVALRRILTDHGLRSQMQVGARQAAIHYSWQTITAAMARIYDQIVAARHAAPLVAEAVSVS